MHQASRSLGSLGLGLPIAGGQEVPEGGFPLLGPGVGQGLAVGHPVQGQQPRPRLKIDIIVQLLDSLGKKYAASVSF